MSALEKARLLVMSGRYGHALEQLAHAADAMDEPVAWQLRTTALMGLGRFDEAESAGLRAIALDPESTQTWLVLGLLRTHVDDLAGAEEALLAGLALSPEDPDLLGAYAMACALAGQSAKAEALYALARAGDPEDAGLAQIGAQIAYLGSRDAQSESRALQALALDPESTESHAMLGVTRMNRGQLEGAHQSLRTAVLANPANHHIAAIGRQALLMRHWSMWPLRPFRHVSWALVYVVVFGLAFLLHGAGHPTPALVLMGAWLVIVLWSWVVPPIARRALGLN